MKKTIYFALVTLLGTINSFGQVQPDSVFEGQWINPINQVPFITEIGIFNPGDSLILGDTIVLVFNGEEIYTIDSINTFTPNPITTQQNFSYEALFGVTAQAPVVNSFEYFVDLFDMDSVQEQAFIEQSQWEEGPWDTSLLPWVSNRTISANSLSMGVEVAWRWAEHSEEELGTILTPTVPVIQGEDVDFIALPVNFALDFMDTVNLQSKIQIANDFGVYVFGMNEFQEVYDAFILDLFTNPDFYPNQFDFNDFHDWLLEYLTAESNIRIQLLSINELLPSTFELINQGNNSYLIKYDHTVYGYDLFNAQGKLISRKKAIQDNVITLPSTLNEILFIRFKTKRGQIVKKLVQ